MRVLTPRVTWWYSRKPVDSRTPPQPWGLALLRLSRHFILVRVVSGPGSAGHRHSSFGSREGQSDEKR